MNYLQNSERKKALAVSNFQCEDAYHFVDLQMIC